MTAWLAFLREVLEYGPQILAGLGNTLLLAFIITFNGLVGGILVFYLTLSPKSITRRLTDGYISFFN